MHSSGPAEIVQLQSAVSILKAELQRASLVALDSPSAACSLSRTRDVTRRSAWMFYAPG
jgi:hypothetical protein